MIAAALAFVCRVASCASGTIDAAGAPVDRTTREIGGRG